MPQRKPFRRSVCQMYWRLSRPNKKSGTLGYSLPNFFLGLFPRKRKAIRQWSMKYLGNKAIPLKLEYNFPQLGIDCLDPRNMGAASSSVLRVRCSDPCPSFRRPRPGALAAVKLASVLTSNSRFLTGSTATILRKTTFSWPI